MFVNILVSTKTQKVEWEDLLEHFDVLLSPRSRDSIFTKARAHNTDDVYDVMGSADFLALTFDLLSSSSDKLANASSLLDDSLRWTQRWRLGAFLPWRWSATSSESWRLDAVVGALFEDTTG